MNVFKKLFSRRWWLATLLVIIGVAVMVRLGIWQLNRLDERRAANVELEAALNAAPIDLNAEWETAVNQAILENREVIVNGRFLYQDQGLLQLQPWGGRAGVNLITPLEINNGEAILLVDRGWLPLAEAAPEAVEAYVEDNPITLEGYVALTQTSRRAAQTSAPFATAAGEWPRVDIAAIEAEIGRELLPFYVVQSPVNENRDLPYRAARDIDLSEGPHLSYALQWFTFSLMLGVGYLFFVRQREQEALS